MSTLANHLRDYVHTLPFIDTHSHAAGFDTGTPVDDRAGKSLPQLILNDYLLYLAGSTGVVPAPPDGKPEWAVEDAEAHFKALLPLINNYRALTTWRVLREGIRALHPFTEDDITLANWAKINESIVDAYRTHGERAWLRIAVRKAGVIRQNQMVTLPYVTDHWDALAPDERLAQKAFLLPSLILDGYLWSGFASGAPGRKRSMELLGLHPKTYDEYLAFVGKAMDLFKSRGGASVKLLINYHRTLHFDEGVPDELAASLFARDPENPPASLNPVEFKALQDNLCWKMLEMARDRGLPLIVHTGYSWPTSWGDPENMHNLFKGAGGSRLRGLNVDICHSGWPHDGGTMIMARTYRNCYFNLCWTPMLSDTLGRHILATIIDAVPQNKILTGTDCGSAESFLGTVLLLRDQIGDVLARKVELGAFGVAVARDVAKAILHDNPREFYGWKEPRVGAASKG